ncbi:hypothetical protein NE237_026010 [Protea cynaroides]|uniref:Uncharacterized protein n=1 Tax=Protea cynaroides TaxID=273540 RepID=A0A9Q0H842_9MAGN|nr:hypothetical protein NE237_026010 [Protea cynaroides]
MVDEVGDGLFDVVGSGLAELIVLVEQLNVSRVFSYSECGEKEGGAAADGGGFDSNCVCDFIVLRRTQVKITRNGKFMISIIILTLLLYSLLLLTDHYIQYPVIMDFITRILLSGTEKPRSPEYTKLLTEIKEDARNIVTVQIIITIGFCFVFLFSITATIYVSAMAKTRKNLTFKNLFSMIRRTWIRPAITLFYVTLLGSGYALLVLASMGVLVVVSDGLLSLLILGILTALLMFLLDLYLAVNWGMGLVISVLEEACYGLKALGRAAEVINGGKLHFQGFIINLIFALICVTTLKVLGYKFITSLLVARRLVILLVLVNMLCLVKIFYFMVYTKFYYHCKQSHDQEVKVVQQGTCLSDHCESSSEIKEL